jgi:hypothetical protein
MYLPKEEGRREQLSKRRVYIVQYIMCLKTMEKVLLHIGDVIKFYNCITH